MQKINSLEEYKSIIQWNKKRLTSIVKNCFLMNTVMEQYISQGRLYAQKYEDGVLLFVDERLYYNMFYFWKEDKPFPILELDRPVLVEEIDNNNSRMEYLKKIELQLHNAGFELFKKNLQVELSIDDNFEAIQKNLKDRLASSNEQGLKYVICNNEEMYKEAVSLWYSALDETDIPSCHTIMKEDNNLLCIVTPNGHVASTNWWKVNGVVSECRHTVTHPDYYRQGLGSLTLLLWISMVQKQGVKKCITWIHEHNFASLEMCKKVGFVPNNKISKQYILK